MVLSLRIPTATSARRAPLAARPARLPTVLASAFGVDRPSGGARFDAAPSNHGGAPSDAAFSRDPASFARPSGFSGGRTPFFGEGSGAFSAPVFYASSSSSSSDPSSSRPGGRTSRTAAFDPPAPSSSLGGADPALLTRPGGRASRSAAFDAPAPSSPLGGDPALTTRPGGRAGRGDVSASAGGGGGGGGNGLGGGGSGGGGGGGNDEGGGDDDRWSKKSLATGGVAYLGVCVGALAVNEAVGKPKAAAPAKRSCCAGRKA